MIARKTRDQPTENGTHARMLITTTFTDNVVKDTSALAQDLSDPTNGPTIKEAVAEVAALKLQKLSRDWSR
jgi:hypothetical protein